MTLHPVAAERVARRRLAGPRPWVENDPRHGTDTGYASGCRDTCCRSAHARARRASRLRPSPLVPVLGTRRRVEALACMGWSRAELGRRVGRTKDWLTKVLRNDTIQVETALIVAGLFAELCMTRCTTATANRTAGEARAKGWAPPLAWDNIDDPDERPDLRPTRRGVDDVVVTRILAGDWRLTATPAERAEVARLWNARGGSLVELGRLTGWNVHRYFSITTDRDRREDPAA